MSKTVLITGGTGYIGTHTALKLLENGYQPVIIDRKKQIPGILSRRCPFYSFDLLEEEKTEEILRKHSIASVIHLAGEISVGEGENNTEKYRLNNVDATASLLRAMKKCGTDILVFSSTAAVYSQDSPVPFHEDSPVDPVSVYGQTKLAAEELIREAGKTSGPRHVIFRYFNAAGAHPSGLAGENHIPETHLIPRTLRAALSGTSLTIHGSDYPTKDGTCIRDYIHVCDIANAHLLSLKYLQSGGKNGLFNIGTGQGFSVMEIIRKTEQVTSRTIRTRSGSKRQGDVPELYADSGRAQKQLGWQTAFSDINTILKSAWEWEKRQDQL